MKWFGFDLNCKYIVEVKECCTCRERVRADELLENGMCSRCTDIENKMMERLAGKWGRMVLDQEWEQQQRDEEAVFMEHFRKGYEKYKENKRRNWWS